jgi:hypothetical protein
MWPASSLKKPANKSSAGVKLGESLVDIGLLGERVHNLLVESGLPIEHVDGGLKVARERLLAVRDLFDELDRFYEHLLLDPNGFGKFSHTFLVRPVVSLARTGVRLTGMSIDIRRCRINGFLLGLGRRFSNLSVLLADAIEKVLEFLKKDKDFRAFLGIVTKIREYLVNRFLVKHRRINIHFILPFVGLVAWLALSNLARRRDTPNHKEA